MKEDRVSNEEVSLDEMKRRLAEFAKDRNWDKFTVQEISFSLL